MGMKAAGRSRRTGGHPYSRVFTSFGAAIDLTEASLSPATVGGASPTVGSAATGARHGATGLIVYLLAAGTLTWRDGAGIQSAAAFAAPPATGLVVNLPFDVTEISSFTGAGNYAIAYWDD